MSTSGYITYEEAVAALRALVGRRVKVSFTDVTGESVIGSARGVLKDPEPISPDDLHPNESEGFAFPIGQAMPGSWAGLNVTDAMLAGRSTTPGVLGLQIGPCLATIVDEGRA